MTSATVLPAGFVAGVGAFLGLILGSFATVVSHRVPQGMGLGGRSRCPRCDRQLSAAENVPVLSYVALRGRCRGCGTRIPARYPLIEIATGVLLALVALRFGLNLKGLVYGAFVWVLVVLTVIDLERRLLPNRIVYPAFVAGWVALAGLSAIHGRWHPLLTAAEGMAIFGGFFLLVALIVPSGIGMGDVKIAFVLGTFLGYLGAPGLVLVGMFLAFLLGGITGLFLRLLAGATGKTAVPFGPFLAAGTVVTVLWGQFLLDAYLGASS